ncbi:hypothetical protein [Jannaschia sp. R86511]|uniref:putative acetyltransferase n=1 Tax=Jannaschia sp. R86511 TaxID=3093853 RepID=UPI0036D427CD
MEHSVVAGLPRWVGRRVVVRHLLPDGRATDALGTLLSVGERSLRVRRDRVAEDDPDAVVQVALADVVLAKPVPPPPPRRGPRRG